MLGLTDVVPRQVLRELQVRAKARAEARALARAQAQEEEQARTRRTRAETWAVVLSLAGARARAEALVCPQGWAEVRLDALSLEGPGSWAAARARAEAWVEALAQLVRAEARAVAKSQAEARAEALVEALGGDLGQGQAQDTFTYDEVLADSRLKRIIYSIEPDYRHALAHDLWSNSNTLQRHWWFIQIIIPITRLPQELLQQIFLVVINSASHSPLVLMLVSKYWYTTVTSIWASLSLGTKTPKIAVTSKLLRNQWLLDVSVDTEFDRGDSTPSEGDYEAIFAAMEETARWRSFIIETFPPQAHLPEHFVNRGLQRCSSDAVMSRLRTFKVKSACEMSPLLDRLLRILGTAASTELTTVEINSASVISFLVPTHPSVFHSVTVLSLDTPGLRNPVDLLPHLHQLETLTASRLSLPIYRDDVDLPFVHTLRHLSLRAVSIQWMSGRTFHALKTCTLSFPLHRHVLHTFSTNLPNCKELTFQGYPLNVLNGVSAHKLTQLSVTSSTSDKARGDPQLVRFSSQALRESRLAPRILHISIEATSSAWTKALALMSTLEELLIDNAQPSSLEAEALHSLIVNSDHASNSGATATLWGLNTPVCPSLKRFGLRYRRWLRTSEHFDLIPEFMSIIWSRQQSNLSLQSFRIWTQGDQKDPLELIDGFGISHKGFRFLANDCGVKGENLLGLALGRLVEVLSTPSRKSSTTCLNCN
jgi:hypothetical protein